MVGNVRARDHDGPWAAILLDQQTPLHAAFRAIRGVAPDEVSPHSFLAHRSVSRLSLPAAAAQLLAGFDKEGPHAVEHAQLHPTLEGIEQPLAAGLPGS